MGQSKNKLSRPSTVHDHIKELQMRFVVCALVLLAASVVLYFFYDKILIFLTHPLGASLYYNTPAGSFTFVMRICMTGALIFTIPVITYNLIMFIRPAFLDLLPAKRVAKTILAAVILSVAGAAFAFYIILPGTLSFFGDFQVRGLDALISADSYLSFVTNIIITFVVVFQIPLIISFVDRIKPLKPKDMLKMEKWVILGSLIIALLAPFTYDLITSLLIALPIIVLYNLSIISVVIRHNKLARRARKAVHATIAKPVVTDNTASFLPELSFENFSDELITVEKPMPVSTLSNGSSVMDISRKVKPQTNIKPAAWVAERKAQRAAMLNRQSHVHVFSDFRRPVTN